MLRGRKREIAKRLLFKSRAKLVYDRITHTRFTTLYFFVALFSCVVLSSLQSVLLFDNTNAVNILENVVNQADVPPHITMFMDNHIQVCDHIPGHVKDVCSIVIDLSPEAVVASSTSTTVGRPLERRAHDDYDDEDTASFQSKPHSGSTTLNSSIASPYPLSCVYSLSWLEEVLHDSQREDVATLFFEVWLFTLGLVAILNESLPHLGAAIFGHILGGAWSASRIQSTRNLLTIYRKSIVPGPCEGTDLLGSWWELRLVHTIPVVAANGVCILALGFASWKLFGVYHKQTLSRVGASPVIHNVYKLVLFFSVGLQLASFFMLVSTAIWAAKVAQGAFKALSDHHYLYVVTFVIVFVLVGPWLLLGWICVRRECKTRFWIFMPIAAVLVAVSCVMFSLKLYRCIFMSWQFFATLTVTAFVFLVVTTVMGIACYLNYGKGLAHYPYCSSHNM
ncbi:hypothetical protein FA13DRAFT_1509574 [Coprinellus micaceus]|uniref:Transmembrane protein n=1 Tax=Coprinellus micaceus TaxID=71717 RepID=A0A4Y7SMH2_COPMI|nr:hypothetical protein FA13DRAFT_1509574 [Coprinellus micaceus]